MKAILFTQFPPRFIEDTIRPKLLERGVEVLRCEHPQRADRIDLTGAEVLLFMNEMGSHSSFTKIKDAAKVSGLPLRMLPRKSALWPADLREVDALARREDEEMAKLHSVPDDAFSAFLREYMALWEAGHSQQEMVPSLRKYWKNNGPLRDGGQLNAYVRNAYEQNRCPAFFNEWWETVKVKGRPAPSTPPPTLNGAAPESTDSTELVKLYEEENAKLTAQVKELAAQLASRVASPDEATEARLHDFIRRNAELEKQKGIREGVVRDLEDALKDRDDQIKALQRQRGRIVARGPDADDLVLTIQQVQMMVQKGFLTPDDAFAKLVTYATSARKEERNG